MKNDGVATVSPFPVCQTNGTATRWPGYLFRGASELWSGSFSRSLSRVIALTEEGSGRDAAEREVAVVVRLCRRDYSPVLEDGDVDAVERAARPVVEDLAADGVV